MSEPLWEPGAERIASARLTAFIDFVSRRHGLENVDYATLYDWSIREIGDFWAAVWDFGEVVGGDRGDTILVDADKMPGARFFPEARLNFAENLLRRRGGEDALVFWGEDAVCRRLSHDDLHRQVAALAAALRDMGVVPGDRVAAFLPNIPEAIVGMLAAASIGAIWTSCSPDFGVAGVVDRFGQVAPKVLLCADGYRFKGRWIGSFERLERVVAELPSVRHVIVAGYGGAAALEPPGAGRFQGGRAGALQGGRARALQGGRARALQGGRTRTVHLLDEILAAHDGAPATFERFAFDHPLYVLYSSGTTGKPKCIVHGAGGTLLKHIYEHQLMCDVRPGDRIFYFTTCGWMMWNWLASGLASEATLLLYDGMPMHPRGDVLFDFADAERMTLFGTSAKFIDALRNTGLEPARTHDLSPLRTITSTGSPLAPEGFDYVYERIKRDVCLSSIAGGTDIVGCFVGGNPIGPVWRGEIQARGLGMAVDCYDHDGNSLRGDKGELVCTRPFPSMPVGFWDDPDDVRYRAAYFERYPGVWWHGDFIEITARDGVIIYGRSDATLNPGGVRIGTAEIYRQVEKLAEIEEGLVIGQDWNNDVRVVLFVKLAAGATLDDPLVERIKSTIRTGASPRHVPAVILAVADIPRTKSGKITELAVRDVVHGRPVANREALANPAALELFANRPELSE